MPSTQRHIDTWQGPITVFLIGMRVNRWWKPWAWLPVIAAMGRMLRELGKDPSRGLLGGEQWVGRTTLMVQYWQSHEQLMAYAHDRERQHVPAWARFVRSWGREGDVGVWHETYQVPAGAHESVYVNMPRFGLGALGGAPAGGQGAPAASSAA